MTLTPSFHGYVATPKDAALLICAAADPNFSLVTPMLDRLSLQDRATISSGCVFVWNEKDSGMKRWTDGKRWSKSRVEGLFLIYKQMEAEPAGTIGLTNPPTLHNSAGYTTSADLLAQANPSSESFQPREMHPSLEFDPKYALQNPDVKISAYTASTIQDTTKSSIQETFSRKFKIEDNPDALCKKTFAISLNGNVSHVVLVSLIYQICYFTKNEVSNHSLPTPSNLSSFKSIKIPATLLTPDNFRLHTKTVSAPPGEVVEPEDLSKKNYVVIQRTGQIQLLRIFLSDKFPVLLEAYIGV